MSIYTRTGDDGTTHLPGVGRVPKTDPRIAAGGAVDELCCLLGLCRAAPAGPAGAAIDADLRAAQEALMTVGAVLAAAKDDPAAREALATATAGLERRIDRIQAGLSPVGGFLLPAGTEAACRLHLARAVCRRAERAVLAAGAAGADIPAPLRAYLNRLGDLLFVLARLANHAAGREDQPWRR